MDSFYVCQLHVLRWIRMGDRVEFSDKTRRRRRLMIKIDFDEIEINTVNHMWRHIIHSLAAIATNADKYFYQKAIVFFFCFFKERKSRVHCSNTFGTFNWMYWKEKRANVLCSLEERLSLLNRTRLYFLYPSTKLNNKSFNKSK